jgi:glucose-1-phosphate adenylyltransferase
MPRSCPPAKFIHDEDGRRGMAVSSLVSGDCIVSGPDCHVGRNVTLKRCVVDAQVNIPEGLVVGEDPELDRKRFRVSEKGIALITQDMINRLQL